MSARIHRETSLLYCMAICFYLATCLPYAMEGGTDERLVSFWRGAPPEMCHEVRGQHVQKSGILTLEVKITSFSLMFIQLSQLSSRPL